MNGLGIAALVLECVPAKVAKLIAQSLDCPVIGIGAGVQVDGQVLVLQDLLGANRGFHPKFLRHYADLAGDMLGALNHFHEDVIAGRFPGAAVRATRENHPHNRGLAGLP